ncbi:MAG: hypothetical protein NWP83_03905, partial [Spirosomaceae bacterium]|nr:hypothetical protein [Spirosomataceae bacterium]
GKDIILRNTTTDQSGKYTVKVTLNGCSKVDTTEVIVKHRPQVTATDVTICSGDTLFLNATRDSTSTYKWVGPLSFTSSEKDTLIAKARVSNSGNYIVTATLNGCSSFDTATVVVKPLPLTVPLSNSPVCEASPINLSAENAGTNATYAWSGPDGFTTDVQNPIIDSATLQKAGFYTLTVSRNGCVKTDSVEIEIKQLPQIIFTNNSPICVNDTLKISIQPIAGATYQWSGPKEFMSADSAISLPNIQTDHAGTYQVTVKLNGCEKTDSTTVRVVENPLAEILTNSPVCELDTLKLTAANAGDGAAYEWSGPNNFSSSESNPSVAPMTEVTAGFYYLKVSLNNCVAFDTTEVQFKPIPKVNLTSTSHICVGDT